MGRMIMFGIGVITIVLLTGFFFWGLTLDVEDYDGYDKKGK